MVEEELGKPPFETLTAEIIPLLAACRWTERNAARLLRPTRVRGGGLFQIGQSHRVERVPLGDVAIIATWNYPIQLLGIQLVHAIAGGNNVWAKPSERSPKSHELLLDLAREAGLSSDRLSVTPGTREAGEDLLTNRRFDHVVFTGSTRVGKAIAAKLAETLTPSTLELSGSDSAIVFADADLPLAARSIAFALRLNAGQTCMAPRRVLVQRDARDAFVEALKAAFAEPRISTTPRDDEARRSRSAAEDAAEAGGAWIIGEDGDAPGVVGNADTKSALFLGEHFGPAMAVHEFGTTDDALSLHGGIPKKLATAVFTRDRALAASLVPLLGSGVVTVNDCVIPTGHPGVGISGIGDSGWGVSRGAAGLLAMTRPVYVSRTASRVRTPTSEPGGRVRAGLARWVRRLYG